MRIIVTYLRSDSERVVVTWQHCKNLKTKLINKKKYLTTLIIKREVGRTTTKTEEWARVYIPTKVAHGPITRPNETSEPQCHATLLTWHFNTSTHHSPTTTTAIHGHDGHRKPTSTSRQWSMGLTDGRRGGSRHRRRCRCHGYVPYWFLTTFFRYFMYF